MDLGLHPRGVTEGAGGEVIADVVLAPLPLWRRRSLVGFSAHLSGCARERFGVVPPYGFVAAADTLCGRGCPPPTLDDKPEWMLPVAASMPPPQWRSQQQIYGVAK
jgi:hypothetical protein